MSRYKETVTILNAPLASGSYGSEEHDWDTASSATVPGRLFNRVTDEQNVNQDRIESRAVVHLEPDAPIDSASRVVHDGVTWEVEGKPNLLRRGATPHHWEVVVTWVAGG